MSATARRKGWCPSARRPMASGDGLIVRARAPLCRLSAEALAALADTADACGSGWVELTNRASLQLRGVREAVLPEARARLEAAGLLDPDPAADARPQVLVAPLAGHEALDLAARLTAALADAPALPPKFGFVVDDGPALAAAPGDIRLERGGAGWLLVADGSAAGTPVATADAPAAALAMARAFADHPTVRAGATRRMAAVAADFPGATQRHASVAPFGPGAHRWGVALGLPFGRMRAEALAALAAAAPGAVVALTPWRRLALLGAPAGLLDTPAAASFVADPGDPRARIDACAGAPACPSAYAPTLPIAEALTPPPGVAVHVSGCAKGCARPGAAAVTLAAAPDGWSLILKGSAADAPAARGLSQPEALAAARAALEKSA
jgi:precorrin-3B synthase